MGLGSIGDLMKLAGQAGKLRENMERVREKAQQRVVEGEAGGGMVKVKANGAGEVLEVLCEPEALKDPDSLGPLIAAAVNVALKKGREAMLEDTREAMGGIDLPAGFPGIS